MIEIVAHKPISLHELMQLASIRGYGSRDRSQNSVVLLMEIGLLRNESGLLKLTDVGNTAVGSRKTLAKEVAKYYSSFLNLKLFSSFIQRNPHSGDLLVDRIKLPLREIGLPYLVSDLGILERTSARHWRVSDEFISLFLESIESANLSATRSKVMTPAEQKEWLENRRIAGEFAEAFAFEFELSRLSDHPQKMQIRWISEEDAGAGFDLLSFDDLHSVLLDRCIEVKGHSGDRSFHWPSSEIEKAKEMREGYWMYLVDRSKLKIANYIPEIYRDPYSFFIETNPAGWSREPTSFKFSAPI